MKALSTILALAFLSLCSDICGQTYFQKVYQNSPYNQEGQDVLATPDGGYLIAGYTTNSTLNDCDIYVLKADANGNKVWDKSFGGNKPDFPYHMLATADGNYFLIGYSQSYGGGDFDIALWKIDPSGNLLNTKTYGDFGNDMAKDIIATSDGNYVIVGWTYNLSQGNQNANLIKIDPAGNVIWSKQYGGSMNDYGCNVKQCADGGYIMLGQTFSYGVGNGDVYLVKTDAMGDTLWTKTYGGAQSDEGIYITVNNDNSFTFLVRDSSNAGKDIDVRITKTDMNGNVLYSKVYGGNQKDTPKMIQPTADGGYIVAAISRSFGWINPDMWIMKFTSSGDTTWTRHYGGANNEHAYVAREQADGSFISVGKTSSYGPDMDAIFLKLNSNGTLAVGVNEISLAQSSAVLYPNPNNGTMNISFGSSDFTKVTITDLLGRTIYAKDVNKQNELNVMLPACKAGLYYLQCESETTLVKQKFIIH